MDTLSSEQAYAAMFLFLAQHYERTQEDDVGALLSDLQIMADGGSADPAALADWQECVAQVQTQHGYPEIMYFRLIRPE
jgi:hypothetical protein